jgi:hypothetical protein
MKKDAGEPVRERRPFNWFLLVAASVAFFLTGTVAQAKLAQLYPSANPGIAWVGIGCAAVAVWAGVLHSRKVSERQLKDMVAAQRPLPRP